MKTSALLGLVAGIAAIATGCIFLLFALPSLGKPGELDWLFSQAAGGILIVLLGLDGLLASALSWPGKKPERAALLLAGLIALSAFAFLAANGEWTACATIILVASINCVALYQKKKNTAGILFLFLGLFGFLLCQAAVTLLPYGWKAWALPGVLFTVSGLFISFPGPFGHLAVVFGKLGRIIPALVSLAAIVLAVSALVYLPGPAGPGTFDGPADPGPKENSTRDAAELAETESCNCTERSAAPKLISIPSNHSPGNSMIISPGDVRTYPYGKYVHFNATPCDSEPCSYLWQSKIEGILSENQNFTTRDLTVGWHNITLIATNSTGTAATFYVNIGIAEPWVCGNLKTRPMYYPVDTPCADTWPDAPAQCQEMEVCHSDLDWIVAEAVDCCDGTPLPGSACSEACNKSGGDRKKCRGLFLINAFGPEARYMKGYAIFKACCSGYPECTRMCSYSFAGTCSFRDGFNANVSNLSCRPDDWGISAWHSDTNMSENSAALGLYPTHATVNILQTGVCSDYSAALTTMLRKAGYNKSEAFSTSSTGYDLPLVGKHPGHAYNLVLLPGDSQYHIVDTTGNGDGINLDGVPGYFKFTGCFLAMPSQIRVMDWWVGYCKMISPKSYNDAGKIVTPAREKICGCGQAQEIAEEEAKA